MFEHSVKVPRLYKTAAKFTKEVKENNGSLKRLIFEDKHVNKKAIYALVLETLQRETQIDFLLKKTQLLKKESRLDPWLARILITEYLWGKKTLPGNSKPVKSVLAQGQILKAYLDEVHDDKKEVLKKAVDKPRYVRVNTIFLTINEAIDKFRDEGWTFARYVNKKDYSTFLEKAINLQQEEFMNDIHIKELLLFPPNTQFYQHDLYKTGHILLQDKASCLPVKILDPQPGSVVLDMCAAPGMKTSQLAEAINNKGIVYAVEMDENRFKILNKFIEKVGATCVKMINKDVLKITYKDCPNINYILVDPSCSGSGITDRIELSPTVKPTEERLKNLSRFQIKILKHALRSFPDVKRVVYSTCSIYPEENEEVIREVISSNHKFKLRPVSEIFSGNWFNYGSSDYGKMGSYCLYAKPEQDLTNGFFIAVFERLEEGEVNEFFVDNWNSFITRKLDSKFQDENGEYPNKNGEYNYENEVEQDENGFQNNEDIQINKQHNKKKEKIQVEKKLHVINHKVQKEKKLQNKKLKHESLNNENEICQDENDFQENENVQINKKQRKKKEKNQAEKNLHEKNEKIQKEKKFQNKKIEYESLNIENESSLNIFDDFIIMKIINKNKEKKLDEIVATTKFNTSFDDFIICTKKSKVE